MQTLIPGGAPPDKGRQAEAKAGQTSDTFQQLHAPAEPNQFCISCAEAVLNEGSFSSMIRTSNRQSETMQIAKPSNSTIRCQRKDRRLADIRDGLSSITHRLFKTSQPCPKSADYIMVVNNCGKKISGCGISASVCCAITDPGTVFTPMSVQMSGAATSSPEGFRHIIP